MQDGMYALVALLFFGTLVIGLVVGARLLWLHRRTGGLPELAIGVAALSSCLGGLVRAASLELGGVPGVDTLFTVLYAAASIGLALGTWKVFRPGTAWAGGLALVLSTVLVATVPARWLLPEAEAARSAVAIGAAALVSVWMAAEALLHWRKLQRRMRIGLADAVTTFQFLSWGVAMAANTAMRLLGLAFTSFTALEPLQAPAYMLPGAALGFATLALLYLASFPPRALQGWLAERAAGAEA